MQGLARYLITVLCNCENESFGKLSSLSNRAELYYTPTASTSSNTNAEMPSLGTLNVTKSYTLIACPTHIQITWLPPKNPGDNHFPTCGATIPSIPSKLQSPGLCGESHVLERHVGFALKACFFGVWFPLHRWDDSIYAQEGGISRHQEPPKVCQSTKRFSGEKP